MKIERLAGFLLRRDRSGEYIMQLGKKVGFVQNKVFLIQLKTEGCRVYLFSNHIHHAPYFLNQMKKNLQYA
jgi:hypothetical protein